MTPIEYPNFDEYIDVIETILPSGIDEECAKAITLLLKDIYFRAYVEGKSPAPTANSKKPVDQEIE